jgi:hypothetical protein
MHATENQLLVAPGKNTKYLFRENVIYYYDTSIIIIITGQGAEGGISP